MPATNATGFAPLEGETAADFTARVQRERLMNGMVRAVTKRGFPKATITDIVSPVGLGRNTFYRHFEDKRDCFLASGERWFGQVDAALERAGRNATTADRTEHAVTALLQVIAADEHAAAAWLVGAMGAGPDACERRRCGLDRIADRLIAHDADRPPPQARGAVGAACHLIAVELAERGTSHLEALRPDLTWLLELAEARVPA